jgi:hypothetical protein
LLLAQAILRQRCANGIEALAQLYRGLFSSLDEPVEGFAHDAGASFLRVADLAGLEDVLAGKADVLDGRDILAWNIPLSLAAMALDLAAFLRGVIFIGELSSAIGEMLINTRIGEREGILYRVRNGPGRAPLIGLPVPGEARRRLLLGDQLANTALGADADLGGVRATRA